MNDGRPSAKLWPWQFSLKHVLIGTAAAGLASLALASANDWWVAICFSFTIALLSLAILLAIYSTGEQRAYWLGFLICGWTYAFLVSLNIPYHFTPDQELSREWFLTVKLSRLAHEVLFPWPLQMPEDAEQVIVHRAVIADVVQGTSTLPPGADEAQQETTHRFGPDAKSFEYVADSLWTLLIAWLGGKFAQWAFWQRQRPDGAQSAAETKVASRS